MSRRISVVIERDANGFYAYVPELPGCHTQAGTIDEAVERIKEAAELYLETLSPEDRDACLSKDILTASVDVQVA